VDNVTSKKKRAAALSSDPAGGKQPTARKGRRGGGSSKLSTHSKFREAREGSVREKAKGLIWKERSALKAPSSLYMVLDPRLLA